MSIKTAFSYIKQLQVGEALTEQDIIAIALIVEWIEQNHGSLD
jgi:hypothetical protein